MPWPLTQTTSNVLDSRSKPFGGESVQVATVPALLSRTESERAVRALATDLEGLDDGVGVDDVLRRLAATTACHAAVKANDRLTVDKMHYILHALRQTDYSTVCPHGRPIVLRLSREQIRTELRADLADVVPGVRRQERPVRCRTTSQPTRKVATPAPNIRGLGPKGPAVKIATKSSHIPSSWKKRPT